MIPLTEWSRRRPPPPAFPAFDLNDAAFSEVDDSGVIEFDGLLGDLIEVVQANAALEAHASVDAKCAGAKRDVLSEVDAKVEAFAVRIGAELIQHFNAVLKPWMGKQIEVAAIDAFCAAVSRAVGDELSQEITVEVPEALQEKLIQRFGAESIKTNLINSPDAEMRAKVGATSISTEISAWQAKLDSVLS